ncbi:1-phosphofructokinase family hexose kinase [Planosporangium mesophilum]|nr:PfkB family carbohydrate kinase [Planosporangium mesophilum]
MVGHVMVFVPAPRLTVTIELLAGAPDIHLHPGGQGVWQARMLRAMDTRVVLCAVFGGETGQVTRDLLADTDLEVRAVDGESRTGAYVHDRRGGDRIDVAEMPGEPLSRHEVDELYGLALAEGLRAGVCLLGGPGHPPVVEPEVYRRLAADLSANGCLVVADLRGAHLHAAAAGGVRLIKVSHEELLIDGDAGADTLDELVRAASALRREGVETVIVTRGQHPALALIGDEVYEVVAPLLEAVDTKGAGDSTIAAIVASIAQHEDLADAIRTGVAAGTLNVTRHGLGSGQREAIMELRERVRLQPVRETGAERGTWEGPHLRATPEELAERIRPR